MRPNLRLTYLDFKEKYIPRLLACSLILFLGVVSHPASAEVPPDLSEEILEPLEVTATRSTKPAKDIPHAINRLDQSDIQKGKPTITLDEALSNVPGLFSQNQFNFAQDLKISIRGFGARSPFGVRGIKILVDGIPQTLPDGQSQLDSIDPGMVNHIEVLRGPSASLYGNASGGVISVFTDDGPEGPFEAQSRWVFGEFGLLKSQLKLGGRGDTGDYSFYASRLEFNGFREHSVTENLLSQIKINFRPNDSSEWMVVARKFYSPRAEDPGALTSTQAEINPRQASSRSTAFDTGEEVDQETLGIRFRRQIGLEQELSFTAHLIHREFSNRLPFVSGGRVRLDRWAPGLAAKFVNDHPLMERPNRWILGVDYLYQNDDRQRFDNNFGSQGALTFNQLEVVDSVGPYFRNELKAADKIDLVAGARFDWVHYAVDDTFLSDGNQSGSQSVSQGSGNLGLVYHFNSEHHGYFNAASVFEVPTTTELINNPNGSGGFNPNLEPQTSLSYELGIKGQALWDYEIALFYIKSKDEILPFELPASPGRTFFRNAGKSERKGLEVSLRMPPVNGWEGRASYTYSDFEFTELVSSGVDLAGKNIPGIPRHRIAGEIKYQHPTGWFSELEVQHVGEFFVNDENTAKNGAYTASRFIFGVKKKWRTLLISVFAGLNNSLDESYNANTRINAGNGQYFEPAPPFNVFGGISVTYTPSD